MIFLLCLLSFALAEPPVGDSYLEAVQLNQDFSHQQYLPPDQTIPSTRTSTSFNVLSQNYEPPDSRTSLSSKYEVPSSRTSMYRDGISQEYGTPIARSSQYDLPNSDLNRSFSSAFMSGVSQNHGSLSSRNFGLYNPPSQRSSPSTKYGTPQFLSSNQYTAHPSPVRKYGVPTFESTQTHSKSISQEYGTSSSSQLQQSLGRTNGFSSRLQNTQLQNSVNPFQSYGTPARFLPSQYATHSVRNSASSFRGSASSTNLNTKAIASSYPSARSPSLEYGAPSSRTSALSQEYGVPKGSLSDQGYAYARNALEILNQKPANYEFAYKVSDDDTGSDFGHTESRQLDRAEGTYFVVLPDGTKQVVEYEADEDGFKPRISVETIDSETSLRAEGPY